MSHIKKAIDKFIQSIEKSPGLWRSVDIRILASKSNGHWHNLLTRCNLDSKSSNKIKPFKYLPVTKTLACWQVVISSKSLQDF